MDAITIARSFYRKDNLAFYAKGLPHGLLCKRIPEKPRRRRKDGTIKKVKVTRRTFIRWLVLVIIFTGYPLTTRELASLSRIPWYHQTVGMKPISHTWVSTMLRELPTESLERLVLDVSKVHKDLAYQHTRRLQDVKIFDVTTWTVGLKRFQEVAKINQHARGVRLAMRIDWASDTPEHFVNASTNSSDNHVFNALIRRLKRRNIVFVFDRGFSRLAVMRQLVHEGNHFVTRWDNESALVVVADHTDEVEDVIGNGLLVERDCWVVVGSPRRQPESMLWRYLTVRHLPSGSTWNLLTDLLTESIATIVTYYELRWRIEVHFRWVKSTLRVRHVPVTTLEGITNFLYLCLLAYLLVRIAGLLWRGGDPHEVSPTWARRWFVILHVTCSIVDFIRSLFPGIVPRGFGVWGMVDPFPH